MIFIFISLLFCYQFTFRETRDSINIKRYDQLFFSTNSVVRHLPTSCLIQQNYQWFPFVFCRELQKRIPNKTHRGGLYTWINAVLIKREGRCYSVGRELKQWHLNRSLKRAVLSFCLISIVSLGAYIQRRLHFSNPVVPMEDNLVQSTFLGESSSPN